MSIAIGVEILTHLKAPPTSAEVREQLSRVRASPAFDAPERARKFLSYVVEETLQGRAERIKAYSIAVEVFGRNASFDAQNDPAVRIEAGRVRRALERYYLLAGKDDPILITIPKGGYIPVFTWRCQATARAETTPPGQEAVSTVTRYSHAVWTGIGILALTIAVLTLLANLTGGDSLRGSSDKAFERFPDVPRILVQPFEDLTGTPQSAMVARGLTEEVIGQMALFKEITVITRRATEGTGGMPADEDDRPHYLLEGGVRLDNDMLRLTVRLVGPTDGAVVWASIYNEDLRVQDLLALEADIARTVTTAVAQPYGAIFQSDAAQLLRAPPDDWEAYACTLAYYGYRADLNLQTHARVQGCLKHAVERFPGYATGWALLSLTYLDELRFRHRLKYPSVPSLEHATQAAQRAIELDPNNTRALQAEMLAYFFRGDIENALKIGARGFEINPNDTEFTAEYGFRLALSGQWKTGCSLVADAVDRNPGPLGYFEAALALCSYMDNDHATAEHWIRMAALEQNPVYHLILIAILGQRGKMAEVKEARRWLEVHTPSFLDDIRKAVSVRIQRIQDQEHFIDGLRKAGLPVPPPDPS